MESNNQSFLLNDKSKMATQAFINLAVKDKNPLVVTF